MSRFATAVAGSHSGSLAGGSSERAGLAPGLLPTHGMKSTWTWLVLAAACGGGDATPDARVPDVSENPALALSLTRVEADGPDPIDVDVAVTRGGAPALGEVVTITSDDGAVGPISEAGGGHYRARVTPAQTSGNVRLHASAAGVTLDRTAIVLPLLDATWGQAEQVPGLVNTPGYEDSAEISPDGEWLLVSDYSPVDMICCIYGMCGSPTYRSLDPAAPACNNSLGPASAPARPRLPGAERIISPTEIHDDLPSLGIVTPPGTDFVRALPPLIGYGFHRQPDGSFAEPFTIGFAVDGATSSPFGYTFVHPPGGTQATLLFAYTDLRNINGDYGPDTGNDLYHQEITLGQDVNFGTFSLDDKKPVTDRFPALVPIADRGGPQGNPAASSDGVWFDTESGAEDLFFAAGDPLGSAPLAAPVKVALSRADRNETMPYVHADRLYFSANNAELRSSARGAGGDPARAETWSAERVELAAEPGSPRVGAVVAVGEPSIETRDGVEALYFVYVVKTATGLDVGVGRVRHAP